MNDAAIVAAWAAAFAALVGPVVAVCAAHRMGQQENKRLEAAKVFRHVVTTCADYTNTLCNSHSLYHRLRANDDSEINHDEERANVKAERFRIQTLSSEIMGNILSLALLFGKPSTPCVDAIHKLVDLGEAVGSDEFATNNDYRTELHKRMSQVTLEMGELYKSLRRSDSFGDDN